MRRTLAAMLVAACLAVQARGADTGALRELAKWKRGGGDKLPHEIDKLVNSTPVEDRGEIEDALIKIAKSSTASPGARDYSCRMLQRIGTEKCVPALARLLSDKTMSHHARLALERMTDCPQAGKALVAALASAPDALKVGIIGSIGRRGDGRAIFGLSRLIGDSNAEVASAAFMALGQIGGAASLRYLGRARASGKAAAARIDAILLCAEGLANSRAAYAYGRLYRDEKEDRYRAAALCGLARTDQTRAATTIIGLLKGNDSYLRRTALRCATVTPGATLTRSLTGALPRLSTRKRAELIDALAVRGDRAAVDGLIRYLDSNDQAVRDATTYAVGLLGDDTHVVGLLKQVAKGKKGEGALAAIEAMAGDGVDAALVEALSDGKLAVAAAKSLARRESAGTAKALLSVASTGAPEARTEAWRALARTASEGDIGPMMKAMLEITDGRLRSAAGKAVEGACRRASNKQACFDAASRHYDRADEGTKAFIIGLAALTGSTQALNLTRSALKSGSRTVRDRALRSLGAWPNPGAARDLMNLARGGPDERTRIIALKGYISVAERERNEGKRFRMYASVRGLVKRADDKRFLVSKLAKVRNAGAIKMLSEYLDDRDVKSEAAAAAVHLARARWRPPKKEMRALLEKVLSSTDNKGITGKAKDALRRLR